MANPTLGWDRIPFFGWWSDNPGVPSSGRIHLTVRQRIRRVDGRMIYPGGATRTVTIGALDEQDADIRTAVHDAMKARDQVAQGAQFNEAEWDARWTANLTSAIFTSFWAADDPDITPHGVDDEGYKVTVTEELLSSAGREYPVQPLIAHLDLAVPGVNLADVEVPPNAPSVPAPVLAKGQPGGIAALDGDGDVVNALGAKVVGADAGVVEQMVSDTLDDPESPVSVRLNTTIATAAAPAGREAAAEYVGSQPAVVDAATSAVTAELVHGAARSMYVTREEAARLSPAWWAILDLAAQDGWTAVYDPTNPTTRTVADGRVAELRDGLGNLPALVQDDPDHRPELVPYGFGNVHAMRGEADARFLRTGPFPGGPMGQPNFILTLAQNMHAGGGSKFLLDGSGDAAARHVIQLRDYPGDRIAWALFATREQPSLNLTQDTSPHVVGALFDDTQSRLWVDATESTWAAATPGAAPLGGLTIGGRYDTTASPWQGLYGPVLIYNGTPPDAVRARMTALLDGTATPMPTVELVAARALNQTTTGAVTHAKNPYTVQAPASTVKLMTAYTMRQWITDAALQETVTIATDDPQELGIGLLAGDVITYEDLLYGAMLPSSNHSANEIARAVGELILAEESGTGHPYTRFLQAMHDVGRNQFGWTGHHLADASGNKNESRLSARQLTDLMLAAAHDPVLVNIMGARTHDMDIGGPNARTLPVTHTIDPAGPVPLPEFIAGKTGTTAAAGANLICLWEDSRGIQHVTALMGSTSTERFQDLRRVIDAAKGMHTA